MSDNKPVVLIVDDIITNVQVLANFLKDEYIVKFATSGIKALEIASMDTKPNIILLDIMMPEMDGYEVCKRLKQNEATAKIPVIFVSAKDELKDKLVGFEVGGVDYITKPFEPVIVIEKLKTYIKFEQRELKKDLALRVGTVGIWEWEYSTNNVIWDDMMYKMYAIKKDENQNLYNMWANSLDSEDLQRVEDILNNSRKTNTEFNASFWITTPNGERKYINAIAKNEMNYEDKAYRMVGVNIDQTKQKLLEDVIRKQKEEFEAIFKYSKDGIAILDFEFHFLDCNGAYLDIIGVKKDDLINTNYLYLSIAEDITNLKKSFEKAKEIGYVQNHEHTIKTKTNEIYHLNTSIVLMPDKKRFLISTKDITENKRKEKLIQNYVDLIDKNVVTSTTDLDGNITSVSEAFCKLSGYNKEELIGKKHSVLRDFEIDKDLYYELWETIKSNKTWKGEIKNRKKDGKHYWVNMTISPIFNYANEKIGYTAIREDITHKKIVEELSITDGLTGIYNRRYFDEIFPKFIESSTRDGEYVCFCILDIDHFKQYNDTYGHQKGDEVLIRVAQSMKNSLRRSDDYCFRLGGEEFAIIFKSNEINHSIEFANHIRESIQNLNIPHEKNSVCKYLTVSVGLVCKKAIEIKNKDQMYKLGDELLYQAKQNGRNRVCTK